SWVVDFKGWRGRCAVIGSGLSGGAAFVTVVQSADLRHSHDPPHCRRLNGAWLRRVLPQR
ncbi:MAG TPA: hypothetical protein VKH63_03110, partial [Candidatus Acidoferrum sp.]|nr:hypothetical protein [Candidatus Acidoferrum sp.]